MSGHLWALLRSIRECLLGSEVSSICYTRPGTASQKVASELGCEDDHRVFSGLGIDAQTEYTSRKLWDLLKRVSSSSEQAGGLAWPYSV